MGEDKDNTVLESDKGQTFQEYMKRAITPLFVLQLLNEQNMYAYQMTQELKKRSGGRYHVYPYPTIRRLLREGHVEEYEKMISGNRVRNYYSITPSGKLYLKALEEEYKQMHDIVCQIMHYSGGTK